MPRLARLKSPTNIYHIMIRGINREYIFRSDAEKGRYLEILKDIKYNSDFKIYAYVLMDNHVHLLIKEDSIDIGIIMKRIGIRYAAWYNKNHDRIGHLFQDRFKSEAIIDDGQLLITLRYILQNPVKAGICKATSAYRWSSYGDSLCGNNLIDADFILQMFSKDENNQINEFKNFVSLSNDDSCLDFDIRK